MLKFAVSSGSSAMKAMEIKLAVSANNTANANTAGFKKSSTHLQTGPDGHGVEAFISKVDTSSGQDKELSNVDIAEELVGTLPLPDLYKANAQVIKTADEMQGTIIDMKA